MCRKGRKWIRNKTYKQEDDPVGKEEKSDEKGEREEEDERVREGRKKETDERMRVTQFSEIQVLPNDHPKRR